MVERVYWERKRSRPRRVTSVTRRGESCHCDGAKGTRRLGIQQTRNLEGSACGGVTESHRLPSGSREGRSENLDADERR